MRLLPEILQQHQQGALAEAEAGYRALLDQVPRNPDAWHFLGVLATQTERAAWGVDCIRQSLAINRNQPDAWAHLAIAFRKLKEFDAALECVDEALRLASDHADAHNTRGNLVRDLGQHESALACYETALRMRPAFPEAALNWGNTCFALGRYETAQQAYQHLLNLQPQHIDALGNLGLTLGALGCHDEALPFFERALSLAPQRADLWCNRGTSQTALQQNTEALLSFDRALTLQPDLALAHCNRAQVLIRLRRFDEAIVSARQALRHQPDLAEAHSQLGRAYYELGEDQVAKHHLDAALACNPASADYHNSLGNILTRLRSFAEAETHFRRAIELNPTLADYYSNLGTVLREMQRFEEALAACEQALSLAPDFAQAWNNRGIALQALRRHDEALASIQEALSRQPDYPEAYNNRGNIHRDLRQLSQALADYDQAIALRPAYAYAWFNRGNILFDLHRFGEAAEAFAQARRLDPRLNHALGNQTYAERRCCDWRHYEARQDSLRQAIRSGQSADTPLAFLSVSDDPQEQRLCATLFTQDRFPAAFSPKVPRLAKAREKLRIAYLSADLREHAVAYLMTGVFEQHDRSQFEVVALAWGPEETGPTAQRVRQAFDRWVDIARLSDAQVVALIQTLEIDILVDLMGHTQHARTGILAQRPAPVQVNYLGYPGTMGASYLDYLIADAYLIPPAQRSHYLEHIAYLPGCFQANDDRRHRPAALSRAELALPAEGVVFCSFNTSNKLNPTIFRGWLRILTAVPHSVLWLLADSSTVEEHLKQAARDGGIDPVRLVFAPKLPYAQHLDRLSTADLFLDSLPFNAGTTASDALWAGVPVLTCSGQSFAGRMAGSLLQTAGLTDLITTSLADYEARAIQLASTPGTLANLKNQLMTQRDESPLFDTARFTRHLETAFLEMMERHRRGLTPQDFHVPSQITLHETQDD